MSRHSWMKHQAHKMLFLRNDPFFPAPFSGLALPDQVAVGFEVGFEAREGLRIDQSRAIPSA